MGAPPHDGDRGDLRRSRHPAVDLSLDASSADPRRIPYAVHGAGRMGRHPGTSDRALAAGSSGPVLGPRISNRSPAGFGAAVSQALLAERFGYAATLASVAAI